MRVIAGTARSLPLRTPEGMDTRPTTDRIKETLFNMLQTYIPDCVFVDSLRHLEKRTFLYNFAAIFIEI